VALKLDYVTRETLINLRRNLLLTTASMVTVAVSLSMVGVAFLLRYGVDNATERWKNGIEFEVFMNLDATQAQKDRIARELDPAQNPDVKRVRFVGRDEQFRLFRDFFANQPEYEIVRKEDLPESYRVAPNIKDAAVIQAISDRLAKEPGVKQVAFPGQEVGRALRTSNGLQLAMFVIALVLFLASSLLIFNTIRMAIFARRREIEVMKLVGATNWFIRVPFMVEGLAQSVVGALGAFAAIYSLQRPLSHWIVSTFEQFAGFNVHSGEVLTIGFIVVCVGSLIGATSAGVAVTRFLDV
jgi:cell division transport system permease protein